MAEDLECQANDSGFYLVGFRKIKSVKEANVCLCKLIHYSVYSKHSTGQLGVTFILMHTSQRKIKRNLPVYPL